MNSMNIKLKYSISVAYDNLEELNDLWWKSEDMDNEFHEQAKEAHDALLPDIREEIIKLGIDFDHSGTYEDIMDMLKDMLRILESDLMER